jgi:hypothetical protein
MDLQLNQTSDLRTLKMLNIIDEFTREFVPIDVGKRRLSSMRLGSSGASKDSQI